MHDDVVVLRAGVPVTGTVVDSDGTSVAEATVAFLDAPVAMPDTALLTGDDGRFVLSLPVPGRYRLGVYGARGSAAIDLRAEPAAGGVGPVGELTTEFVVRIAPDAG